MSDKTSERPLLRTIARLFLVGTFLSIAGGALFAVHVINKTLKNPPSQVYEPLTNTVRAEAAAANALRSTNTRWNLYRADAGFSIAAPASFTMTFPRPSGDLYLGDTGTAGRAVVRASSLADHIGAKPFVAWKMSANAAGMALLYESHLGKVQGLRADTFVAGWFDYERDDSVGRLECISSVELLANNPVVIEACSTYGSEYDTALLNVAIPTSLASQNSVEYMNPTVEQALDQAFAQQINEPPAHPESGKSKARKNSKDAAIAPDVASGVTTLPAVKLSPRQSWEDTRSVDCYGKALTEIEGCYVSEAKNKTDALLKGDSTNKPRGASGAADEPGVDMVGPGNHNDDSSSDDDKGDDASAGGRNDN